MKSTGRTWPSTLAVAIAVLAVCGLAEGLWQHVNPFHLAALTTVALAWAVLPIGFAASALGGDPVASGAAAALSFYLFASAVTRLESAWSVLYLTALAIGQGQGTWEVLAGQRRSVAELTLLGAGSLASSALLTVAFTRLLHVLPDRVRRSAAIAVSLAGAAILATGFLPGRAAAPELAAGRGDRPSVILLTIETLRPDHLSAYGYRAHRTPSLDRIAAEGALFAAAYAPAPWTLATLASVMTSQYPSALGIGVKKGIPPGTPTLAGALGSAGYVTHAIATNVFSSRTFGMNDGFQGYDHLHDLGAFDDLQAAPLFGTLQKLKLALMGEDARRVTDRAIGWLQRQEGAPQPFFLWLHYFDPHYPYGGPHAVGDLPCGAKEAPGIGWFFGHPRGPRHDKRIASLSKSEREHVAHLYDSDVRFLDRELGRLFGFLDRAGLAASTLLIVTSDHGEEFWDHGDFEHGHSVHEEITRVPLLIRWPHRVSAGTVVTEPVSLIDVMPSVLHVAAVPAPSMQGRILSIFGNRDPRPAVLSENILYGAEQKAIRDADCSVIFSTKQQSYTVYDRRVDPSEMTPLDICGAHDLREALVQLMDENLSRRSRRMGPPATANVSDFQLERLRSLGYVQ